MELSNRLSLESQFRDRLGKLWASQRREMLRLWDDPPDPAKIPEEWWEKCRRENDAALALLLYLVLMQSADQHLTMIHTNDAFFSKLATPDRQAMILGNLEPSLAFAAQNQARALTAKIEARNRQTLAKAVEDEALRKPADVKETVSKLFGESPVERQATTGVTWGRQHGGETAVRHTVGLSDRDLWLVVYGSGIEDKRVCPVCSWLNDKPRSVWSRFFPQGPPSHERCRCQVVFFSETQTPRGGSVPPLVGVS